MVLPTPNLDDRRFQELVDDAKRMVMRKCPEWTDHNVSDPGVTLIETFAFMTDQLLYRLNRVPDRMYVKFLDLIGVRLLPPTPATAPVTFWLSAPAEAELAIDTGTNAATMRTENAEPIVFSTVDELRIVPCSLAAVRTGAVDSDDTADRTVELGHRQAFPAFAEPPTVGDVLLVGLSESTPQCAVRLEFDCQIEGVGVDPTNPPLVWEAWNGDDWRACEVSTDETGGLNTTGGVVVHVPADHEPSVIDGVRAGWLRARVVEPDEGFPQYSDPPMVHGLSARTVGGTVDALHAEIIEGETVGESDGSPGQRFQLARTPVLAGAGEARLEVVTDDGWQTWTQVGDFAESGPDDRHFLLDAVAGTVVFGPTVREADGSNRHYGAAPAADALIRVHYTIGGGRIGNVPRGALQTLQSSIPFVAGVENRHPAAGGQDGETIEQAKIRGPIMLRTRGRAVTAEDYEAITRETAPEIARVRCLTAGEGDTDVGSVRVLLVPVAASPRGRIEFEDLIPAEDSLRRITERLDQVRLIGTRVVVEPPLYRGITVVARLVARPRVNRARITEDALDALYGFLNPISGGPDGAGWPFGRPVQASEIFATLQGVSGVDLVEDIRLFSANPVTGQRGGETTRLELEPNSLIFSYRHQVRVEEH